MRIQIQLFTLMRIRIHLFTQFRIRIQLFTLMRIRIKHFILMRIRIQLSKIMRNHADPDPQPWFLSTSRSECKIRPREKMKNNFKNCAVWKRLQQEDTGTVVNKEWCCNSVWTAVFRSRIWIGSRFNQVSGSWSRWAKRTHKNIKKLRNFMFWSAGCSLLRAEGFFCRLDVLNRGLGIGKL